MLELILIISVFVLILCIGGSLMESKVMDKPCEWLFDRIRGGQEYDN